MSTDQSHLLTFEITGKEGGFAKVKTPNGVITFSLMYDDFLNLVFCNLYDKKGKLLSKPSPYFFTKDYLTIQKIIFNNFNKHIEEICNGTFSVRKFKKGFKNEFR